MIRNIKINMLKRLFILLLGTLILETQAEPVGPGDWSSLRLYGHAYNVSGFTDAEYDWIAEHNYLFTTEKRHAYLVYGSPSSEYASQVASELMKANNSTTVPLFYWNSSVIYSSIYETIEEAVAEHPEWINSSGDWDYTNADFRDWWLSVATDQVNNYAHEGVFLDAVGGVENAGTIDYLHALMDQIPGLVIYNGFWTTNAGRLLAGLNTLEHCDGVYIEPFMHYTVTTPDTGKQLLDNLLQVPADKYIVTSYQAESEWNSTDHKFGMASFLIIANDNSFFRYAYGGYTTDNLIAWDDDFGEYIGAPRGVATVDGYRYSRKFANATVNVDLENATSSIVWGPTQVNDGTIQEIGLIQAEDYNDMSGVKVERNTDVDGGLDVGYIGIGDWIEYEVNVPYSGTYTLDYRLASLNGGGSVQFQVEGITKETTSIASTGGWQDWETLSTSVSLSSGVQTIRLYAAAGGWNINWFELALENAPTGNLALSGIATQSTTTLDAVASRAIDGNTNGAWTGGSVTHTEAITNSWWRVNLGSDYSIGDIKIFNRTDACCTERLSNFTVYVIDAAGNYNFTQTYTTTPNPSITIDAGGVTGKVIRIRSNLADSPLSLAEVEVYSSEPIINTITLQENETGFTSVDGTIDNNYAGFTGDGFANTSNALGNGVDWEIDGSAGDYTFTWRYASTSARAAKLIIDGVTAANNIAFGSTGSWTTWANSGSRTVTLAAGVKSVRLESITTSGLGNIDYMEVTGPDAQGQ